MPPGPEQTQFEPGSIANAAAQLIELVRGYGSCLVAFSGGVDSAVVAQATQFALPGRCAAAIGVSPSLAAGELEIAREVAAQIGIPLWEIATGEFTQTGYRENSPERCYYCKTELYGVLEPLAVERGLHVVANGANLDDRGDYRPGMRAASERAVQSPLLECGLGKAQVRALAAAWGLPVWDKPASPCLSSRIAYGEEVTPERVALVDQAERCLRDVGLKEVRVRYHRGDLARLEVPVADLERLVRPEIRELLLARLRELGFKYVTLDLQGFRSGSLNEVLPLVKLTTPGSAT